MAFSRSVAISKMSVPLVSWRVSAWRESESFLKFEETASSNRALTSVVAWGAGNQGNMIEYDIGCLASVTIDGDSSGKENGRRQRGLACRE